MTLAPLPTGPNDYPQRSQAALALMLGVLGIVFMGVFGPLAWVIGNRELAAIDAGRRPPTQRNTATAGRLLGIVGTVVFLGAVLIFTLAFVGVIPVD